MSAGLTISHAPFSLRVDMAAPDGGSKGGSAGKGAKRSVQPPVEPGKSRAQMIIAAALNEAKEELSRSKSNALPGGQLVEAVFSFWCSTCPCVFIQAYKALQCCVAQHSTLWWKEEAKEDLLVGHTALYGRHVLLCSLPSLDAGGYTLTLRGGSDWVAP